jgi:hypothetical protein
VPPSLHSLHRSPLAWVVLAEISGRLETGHERYAVLALGDPERASAYLATLPSWLPEVIAAGAPTHVWAPCSVCGEGVLVERPPVPQVTRDELKDDDGPRCRITWTRGTGREEGALVRGPGRHYPLHGPWLASHPLGKELLLAPPW